MKWWSDNLGVCLADDNEVYFFFFCVKQKGLAQLQAPTLIWVVGSFPILVTGSRTLVDALTRDYTTR